MAHRGAARSVGTLAGRPPANRRRFAGRWRQRAAWVLVVAPLVLGGAALVAVFVLRIVNDGTETVDQNWWLVAELVVGVAYLATGVALAARPDRRLLGVLFVVVAAAALVDAVATEYQAFTLTADGRGTGIGSVSLWAWTLGSAVLLAPVLLALLPPAAPAPTARFDGHVRVAMVAAGAGIALILLDHLTDPWPAATGSNPLAWTGTGRAVADAAGTAGVVAVDAVGTVAVVLLVLRWRAQRRVSDDPLPGWLAAGARRPGWPSCPPRGARWASHLPAPDVIPPLLLLATVPLVVVGAVIEIVRARPSTYEGVSLRFVEWALLVTGILVIYTGIVAGLGTLVGGSGPTWFLVAATGLIAVLMEPARQGVRALVDRLVYGSRDNALFMVRQVMGHVSSATDGDQLLPALAASLGHQMRLDAVAIDVARGDGWERAATYGSPPARGGAVGADAHEIPLRYHDDVVGRLVVSSADAPSLRRRATRPRWPSWPHPSLSPSAGCASPPTCGVRAWRWCRPARRNAAACAGTCTTASGRRSPASRSGCAPPSARWSAPVPSWRWGRWRCSPDWPTSSMAPCSRSSASSAACGRRYSISSVSSAPSTSSCGRCATPCSSTSSCRAATPACRPPSRSPSTASSPKPLPTWCATPPRPAAG